MKQVETTQATYGKATKKLIKTLCPDATTQRKIGKDVVIRNATGKCVCTWQRRSMKNGLIVIHD